MARVCTVCLLTAFVHGQVNQYAVTDASGLGRRFDGVGAISGGGATSRLLRDYPSAQYEEMLDYLFKPSFGAALHMLKIEIGSEADSTDGSEPSHKRNATDLSGQRGYEWSLMRDAKARNPDLLLYALAWGWPGYLRNGTSASTPWTNLQLTAQYVTEFLSLAQGVHNLTFDYVGLWNEVGYNTSFIPVLRDSLDAAGLSSTRIIAADMHNDMWSIADDIANSSVLQEAVYGVGVHYPGTVSTATAVGLNKPLWASEDVCAGGARGGACLARAVNENYVNGHMTALINWALAAAFYEGMQFWGSMLLNAAWPTSGQYQVNPALWATAHTTQFVQPGWMYLQHGAGVGYLANGGTYVSVTDGRGGLTIVIEKMDRSWSGCSFSSNPPNVTTDETAVFVLGGAFASLSRLQVWYSNFTPSGSIDDVDSMFQPLTPLPVVNGRVTLPLGVGDLYTLTTSAAGSHGNYSSPPAAPFPLPYSDDFDSYPLGYEAAYFSDLSGAFETAAASDGARGVVMKQVTPVAPISWLRSDYTAHSVIGDANVWANVLVSVDFYLPQARDTAAVGVRCNHGIDTLAGVWLSVDTYGGGRWNLSTSLQNMATFAAPLLTGMLPSALNPGSWHTLTLSMNGSTAAASFDGLSLASAVNATYAPSTGWAAIATVAYGHFTEFDAFVVQPQ